MGKPILIESGDQLVIAPRRIIQLRKPLEQGYVVKIERQIWGLNNVKVEDLAKFLLELNGLELEIVPDRQEEFRVVTFK